MKQENATSREPQWLALIAKLVAAPRRPLHTPGAHAFVVDADVAEQYAYEVLVFDQSRGRQLVAAIEIVSPANKDRPENRLYALSQNARVAATRCLHFGGRSGHDAAFQSLHRTARAARLLRSRISPKSSLDPMLQLTAVGKFQWCSELSKGKHGLTRWSSTTSFQSFRSGFLSICM